jgi:hypothetical protein
MASKDPLSFKVDVAQKMAARLRDVVRRYIDSDTLKNAIEIVLEFDGADVRADLVWPHYWAVFYHDGRGPLRPINGKYLVWFMDPEDDPRNQGGYPVRKSDIRRLELSTEEFKALLASGRMIVRTYAGPTRGKKFLERLAGRAAKHVQPIVRREFSRHVKDALADVLKLKITTKLRD